MNGVVNLAKGDGMIHYSGVDVVFQEVPDEISLSFTVTGCPWDCKGCHWRELNEIPIEQFPKLTLDNLLKEWDKYSDLATNILFFGGDWELNYLERLIREFQHTRSSPKFSLYSGQKPDKILGEANFALWNYIKAGPYISKRGNLRDRNTNQVMIDVKNDRDITYKFWK